MDNLCGPPVLTSNARSQALLLRPAREAIWRAVTTLREQQHAPQSHLSGQPVQHEPQHILRVLLPDVDVVGTIPRHAWSGQAQDILLHQLGHKCLCGGISPVLVDHQGV